jgi:hypothetical protein
VSLTRVARENRCINSFSIIPDMHSELLIFINDLNVNAPRLGVLKCVP